MGDESMVRERLGSAIADLRLTRVTYRFDYPFSPAGVVDFFRDYYGPTNRAFAALTAHDQEAFHADLVALCRHRIKARSRTGPSLMLSTCKWWRFVPRSDVGHVNAFHT